MHGTIYLYRQLFGNTVKINNKIAYAVLSPELTSF